MTPDYAEKVLEYEVRLEENCTIEAIKDLNELYGVGIDYFIDHEPIKARHLQKKMANLLSRPTIIRVLEQDAFGENSADDYKPQALNRSLKREIVKFHSEADDQIKLILQKSKQTECRLQSLKHKDLNKQEQHLNSRLLTRMKSQQKLRLVKSCKQIAD